MKDQIRSKANLNYWKMQDQKFAINAGLENAGPDNAAE